jgi:hypothetical protein
MVKSCNGVSGKFEFSNDVNFTPAVMFPFILCCNNVPVNFTPEMMFLLIVVLQQRYGNLSPAMMFPLISVLQQSSADFSPAVMYCTVDLKYYHNNVSVQFRPTLMFLLF